MTHSEFDALNSGRSYPSPYTPVKLPAVPAGSNRRAPVITAPVNHVKSGFLNPVKAQGGCGSCYAFAATNVLEGALAI